MFLIYYEIQGQKHKEATLSIGKQQAHCTVCIGKEVTIRASHVVFSEL